MAFHSLHNTFNPSTSLSGGWGAFTCLFRRLFLLSLLTCHFSLVSSQTSLRDSLSILSAQLDQRPDDVELRLRKAAINMQLSQFDYARHEYDIILNSQPNNLAALFYRAYANERTRRHAYARQDYQRLLAIVPAHFEARLGLALLCQQDKRYTEAMDHLNMLCQQHPDSAIAFAARAGAEADRGYVELAIHDYSKAIQLQPENTDYLLSRADLYIRQRDYQHARSDLQQLTHLGIPRPALEDFYKRLKK